MEGGRDRRPDPAAAAGSDQQLAGVRAWIAQLDHALGVRTYLLAAGLVLALAAAGIALALALQAKDDAITEADLQTLREQVERAESAGTTTERKIAELERRLGDLEDRVAEASRGQKRRDEELSVAQDDIDDLRNQLSQLDSGAPRGP